MKPLFRWLTLGVLMTLILGCNSTGYPSALEQIIAQNAQSQNDGEGISVEQLMAQLKADSRKRQRKINQGDWTSVNHTPEPKQLNWQYGQGDILPDDKVLVAVEQLMKDPKWTLKNIAIGQPDAKSAFAATILAQKRAVRLQLLIPHQVDVLYQPQLGLDKLSVTFEPAALRKGKR